MVGLGTKNARLVQHQSTEVIPLYRHHPDIPSKCDHRAYGRSPANDRHVAPCH